MNPPLIFDTSIWVDFIHKKSTPQTTLLKYYLEHKCEIPLIPVILQEFLQGIREDNQHKKIVEVLRWHTRLELPHMTGAIGASSLFRRLRQKGVTIRKSNDCLIAYYAIRFDLELVHNDRDFDLISANTNLKTWKHNKG
ncbi:MAG: PIN domain nuclease [Chitinophaga sp.]|uniref:type II toxin-antitoxin system VapC family toxin n=1 Tax=Chitinophaga sp. TaxID=1869181 RepID=UPI001B2BE14B|nr:PIN domain nuclease [Chitinophaga sp.]MBO9729253.1 PIN domain nuclease [Chitinophaga sp.]